MKASEQDQDAMHAEPDAKLLLAGWSCHTAFLGSLIASGFSWTYTLRYIYVRSNRSRIIAAFWYLTRPQTQCQVLAVSCKSPVRNGGAFAFTATACRSGSRSGAANDDYPTCCPRGRQPSHLRGSSARCPRRGPTGRCGGCPRYACRPAQSSHLNPEPRLPLRLPTGHHGDDAPCHDERREARGTSRPNGTVC